MTTCTLKRTSPKTVSQTEHPKTLLELLSKLAIDPFEPSSVAQYKNSQVRQIIAQNPKINIIVFYACIYSFGLSLIAGPFLMILFGVTGSWISKETQFTILSYASLSIIFFDILAFLLISLFGFRSAHWVRKSVFEYQEPIPEFVAQTISDIQQWSDSCKFYFDVMEIEEVNEFKTEYDPFLVVEYQGKEYYIEVWNESYQKQRMI